MRPPPRPEETPAERLDRAFRHHQLGDPLSAGEFYAEVLAGLSPDDPRRAEVRFRLDQIDRAPAPPAPARPTVIWQLGSPLHASFQAEWLRHLLSELGAEEVVDGKYELAGQHALIVDQKLGPRQLDYLRRCYLAGFDVGLIHLNDEGYTDARDAYRYAAVVLRNYWSLLDPDDRRVMAVPLGYQSGLVTGDPGRPAADRPYAWGFLGDVRKPSREAMLAGIGAIGPHLLRTNWDFMSPDVLPIRAYQDQLREVLCAPCPAGFVNLESFRVYEALETGCIPIVEARGRFDYFRILLGPHPVPTVRGWSEGAELIRRLAADRTAAERLRRTCFDWWQATKAALPVQVALHVKERLADRPALP